MLFIMAVHDIMTSELSHTAECCEKYEFFAS